MITQGDRFKDEAAVIASLELGEGVVVYKNGNGELVAYDISRPFSGNFQCRSLSFNLSGAKASGKTALLVKKNETDGCRRNSSNVFCQGCGGFN